MANFTEFRASWVLKSTEEFILSHSLDEIKTFIEENGKVEEDDDEFAMFIPKHEKKFVKGKTYDMRGTDFGHDEFIITEDDRVFLAVSLRTNIEILDDEMTSKEMIIAAANEQHGGFVNTDGEWCGANDPIKFRKMLENLGFSVIECKETYNSTAVAITEDGYRIAYNGYCTRV